MKRAPIRLAAAGILIALPLVAVADTTVEQAAALRTSLREWAMHVGGPAAKIPDKLIEVAPEGDHFRLTVALGALRGSGVVEGGTISAAIYPGAGGTWRFDDLRVATPSEFTVHTTVAPHQPEPMDVAASYATMRGHGVVDPSLRTPSSLDMKIAGYDIAATNPHMELRSRIESATSHASLTPTTPGRVDFTQTSAAENYSSQQKSAGAPPVAIAAKHLEAKTSIASLELDRVPPLIRAVAALRKFRREAPGGAAASRDLLARPEGRAALRAAYLAFRGIASGAELKEAVEGVRVAAAGHIVGVDRLGMGWRVATPNGTLGAQLGFAVEGISAPDAPADVQPYVPHHFAITPSLSGIDLADLDALIMAATAPPAEHPDVDARIAALMAHGVVLGLDTLAFNLGPADFSASGKLTAYSLQKIAGAADIKATGFGQLEQDAMKTPALAEVVPVLALVRSLARPEGAALVWSVRLDNGVVTVNGRDVQSLFQPKGNPNHDNK